MPRGVYKRGRRRLPMAALRVWVFIANFIEKEGLPPTYREISAGCFMGITSVWRCLMVLELEGHIERRDRSARGIILVEKPPTRRAENDGYAIFDPS